MKEAEQGTFWVGDSKQNRYQFEWQPRMKRYRVKRFNNNRFICTVAILFPGPVMTCLIKSLRAGNV